MQNLLPGNRSRYLFTVCQVGAEPALKAEMARVHPELRFSFSRPGFVTFKSETELSPDFELRSIFARAYGLSIGRIDLKNAAPDQYGARVLEFAQAVWSERKLCLHLYERDRHAPNDEPKGFVAGEWAKAARARVEADRALFAKLFGPGPEAPRPPQMGDLVLDVIVVEPDEWWIGLHAQTQFHPLDPGGRSPLTLPAEAPSRAYLKLEEGIRFGNVPLQRGDVAVEIGSAPGGASFALLERGLKVVGIDPAEMDARLLVRPEFKHIQKAVQLVAREDLPEHVDWLLLDVNVSPQISLFQVDRLATRLQDTLLGVLLTIKLNDWKLADEIPGMLEHLRAMGMTRLRATQLATNRQEFFVFGLTRLGQKRKTAQTRAPGAK